LASGEAAIAMPADPQLSAATGETVTVTVHSELWRRVSEILAALLVITLFSWWWSARPKRTPREPEPVPIHKQQAKFLKAARKAALAADAATVRSALIDWAALQWPDDAPRSIGNIALRVAAPLSDELLALSRLSYGPESADWNGAALAKALRSFAVLSDDASESEELLPPLMPATSDRN
jgi:hypothetical protein